MGRRSKGDGPRQKRDYKTTDADHARLKAAADRRNVSVNDILAILLAALPEPVQESRNSAALSAFGCGE